MEKETRRKSTINNIPFSNRSGNLILLYDKINQGIYYVNELEITEMIKGKFNPQWSDFDEFLEWYDIN